MPMTIRDTASRLAADGRIDRHDVQELLDAAQGGARPGAIVRRELSALLQDPALGDKFTDEARLDLVAFLDAPPLPPRPHDTPARSIGAGPDGDPVLLKGGLFVADPDAPLPTTPIEIGESCYRGASLIAETDPARNVFGSLSTDEKKEVLEQMQAALRTAPADPDVPVPQGFDNELQPLQMRSSAATVLLELLRSAKTEDPAESLLQDSVLQTYAHMAEVECSSTLRDSMVFQLHGNKDRLVTPAQREVSDQLMRMFAPTQPPYDDWFKDGNDTLNIICHTGGEFFSSEVDRWKGKGFKEVEGESSASTLVLEKTFERNEHVTPVRLTMVRGASGTFDDMDNPDMHIVGYSGHASWGRNIPRELKNAPDEEGKKLVIVNQCCGRGIINKFRDKYADAQFITTKNSSYESEDFNCFYSTIEGVAERRSWPNISKRIRGSWLNSRDNYYFPSDALQRMRATDRDHDGVTDVVDRLVSFNTFKVVEDTQTEFEPKDPGAPAHRLAGTKVHEAVQIINTTTKFSDFLEYHGSGESFVGVGYYAPDSADDPMVRFEVKEGGSHPTYEVAVNAQYAHASEEAIKAESFYTLAHTPPVKVEGDSPLETCLKGLILVGHSLDVDSGYRDDEIFKALLAHHGLPEIDMWTVKSCVDMDHVYAGSAKSIRKLREKLGDEKLAAIEAAL